jgi:hypothetical protein
MAQPRGRTFSPASSSLAERRVHIGNAANVPFYNQIPNIFSGVQGTPQAFDNAGLALAHRWLANAHLTGHFSFCGAPPEELTHHEAVARAQVG